MPKTFYIDIAGYYPLTVEDIWPDGNAPENPTDEDVAVRMREYGDVFTTLRDWNLRPEVSVGGSLVWDW